MSKVVLKLENKPSKAYLNSRYTFFNVYCYGIFILVLTDIELNLGKPVKADPRL